MKSRIENYRGYKIELRRLYDVFPHMAQKQGWHFIYAPREYYVGHCKTVREAHGTVDEIIKQQHKKEIP